MNEKSLSLAKIRIDGGTQPRAAISEDTVKGYAEQIAAGVLFPPIDVFFDGTTYWLADGFHRYFALKHNERLYVTATVHEGTRREAVLFSVSANAGHGLQRTNADKRKAVTTLLQDEEWSKWSNGEIAKRCGVSDHFVGSLRINQSDAEPRTYVTKHGTKATMNVEKIGRTVANKLHPKAEEIEKRLRAGEKVWDIAKTLHIGHEAIAKVREAVGFKYLDRSPSAARARRARLREMAAEGYSALQMASEIGISEESCRIILKKEAIRIPADTAKGRRRINANRIVEQIVMDADHLMAGVALIDFRTLDRSQIAGWLATLKASRNRLSEFINKLSKEQHGEAA